MTTENQNTKPKPTPEEVKKAIERLRNEVALYCDSTDKRFVTDILVVCAAAESAEKAFQAERALRVEREDASNKYRKAAENKLVEAMKRNTALVKLALAACDDYDKGMLSAGATVFAVGLALRPQAKPTKEDITYAKILASKIKEGKQ